jgi:hypothetical protein
VAWGCEMGAGDEGEVGVRRLEEVRGSTLEEELLAVQRALESVGAGMGRFGDGRAVREGVDRAAAAAETDPRGDWRRLLFPPIPRGAEIMSSGLYLWSERRYENGVRVMFSSSPATPLWRAPSASCASPLFVSPERRTCAPAESWASYSDALRSAPTFNDLMDTSEQALPWTASFARWVRQQSEEYLRARNDASHRANSPCRPWAFDGGDGVSAAYCAEAALRACAGAKGAERVVVEWALHHPLRPNDVWIYESGADCSIHTLLSALVDPTAATPVAAADEEEGDEGEEGGEDGEGGEGRKGLLCEGVLYGRPAEGDAMLMWNAVRQRRDNGSGWGRMQRCDRDCSRIAVGELRLRVGARYLFLPRTGVHVPLTVLDIRIATPGSVAATATRLVRAPTPVLPRCQRCRVAPAAAAILTTPPPPPSSSSTSSSSSSSLTFSRTLLCLACLPTRPPAPATPSPLLPHILSIPAFTELQAQAALRPKQRR